jgi:class 3 adenylate cyclase/pimeloyl-ACP methyl ester carboxylesterase
MSDIQYARKGDGHIAYREIGLPGRLDVVMVSGALFPFEMLAEDRVASRFMSGLAALGRLIVFDKSGVGLSDPITDWSRPLHEMWAEDLLAVIEAAGVRDPVVVSWDPFGVARRAAATRPDALAAIVLVNPVPTSTSYIRMLREHDGQLLPTKTSEAVAFPSRTDDEGFRAWLSQSGRFGASPSAAARIWEHLLGFKGTFTPEGVSTRALVLHNRDCIQSESEVRAVAESLPNGTYVAVPGADIYPIAGDVDVLIAEIAEFATGAPSSLAPDRAIAAVLFTDLVDSTQHAALAGDTHWRDLLDTHDRSVAITVRHHGGRVVKHTGDGVLALLPSATGAMDTARSVIDTLAHQGLQVRVGIHVGDVDVRGDDVSGLAVHVAARVMATAQAGETMVSEAVRLATLGCGHHFDDAGRVELKGVPGEWTLYRWVPTSS